MTAPTQGRLSVRVTPELREVHLMAEAVIVALGLAEPDARRLAACWNAFGDVRTEMVEVLVMTGGMEAACNALSDLPAATAERDQLRAELLQALDGKAKAIVDHTATVEQHNELLEKVNASLAALSAELAAARALLREALAEAGANLNAIRRAGGLVDEGTLIPRIRTFLGEGA